MLELAPVRMAAPSLGLLVVLHVGLSSKWTISSAAVVSFATGYLFDLVSGAPQGVHAFVFVLMALFARALTTRLAVQGIVLSAATAFVASLLASALIVIVRAQVAPEGGYGGLRQAPLEALLTGIVAPVVLGPLPPHRRQGRQRPLARRPGARPARLRSGPPSMNRAWK